MTASERTERTIEVASEAARWIADEGARSAVIGAIAMAVHGHARSTMDLDLATELDPGAQLTRMRADFEARGYQVELNLPDADDPLGGVLTIAGQDFDDVQVVNFHNPLSMRETPASRALDDAIPLEGTQLRIVTVEDLVLLKLYAGGLKSLADIAGLLEANPDLDLEELRPTCASLGLEPELDHLQRELP